MTVPQGGALFRANRRGAEVPRQSASSYLWGLLCDLLMHIVLSLDCFCEIACADQDTYNPKIPASIADSGRRQCDQARISRSFLCDRIQSRVTIVRSLFLICIQPHIIVEWLDY